ncbi:acyltransferase family protein [Leptolyngbya sp. AN03gr2]|uniref:acyltransferase family protein n=1 Tax=unclassified Leptolyngbya TaxID=2650499 RepID=UPI003D3148AD
MQWKILAGFRFFLAWIVLCTHLSWFVPSNSYLLRFNHFDGFSAVLGFLIISGYSIAHSVIKTPQGFYRRRVLRLYPLYFLAVIASILPFLILGSQLKTPGGNSFPLVLPSKGDFIGNLLLLQGFIFKPISSNPILWTLSVEFLYYLFAPWFLKLSNRSIFALICISAVTYAVYPKLNLPYYSHLEFGLGAILLLWAWLLGFWYRREAGRNDHIKALLIFVGVILLSFNSFDGQFTNLTYISSCLVVIYATQIKLPTRLLDVFDYLGAISYPLYLFHVPAFIAAYYFLGIQYQIGLVLFALMVSIVVYHVIDLPLRTRTLLAWGMTPK